jgi:membrane protease YdiL (CAAX protease family)
MNHLESSFIGKNNLWRYIVMLAAILIATNTIGAIPLLIGFAARAASDPDIITEISQDPDNLGVLGLEPNLGFFMMLFPFIIGLLTFVILVKPLNNRPFRMTINGQGLFRWNRFLISGLLWACLSAIYFIVYLKINPSNFSLQDTSGTIVLLIVISLIFIPFQAAFEEVIFRGYLMQGFTVISRNRLIPLVITSVLFGLMHAFNPEVEEFGFFSMIPQYILFGLIFGIVTILDDGIEAAIGAHAANNIFLCIMVTNEYSALQTPAVYEQHNYYPWIEFTALLAVGIVFLVILKMIFKWDSFSLVFSRVEEKPVPDHSPYTDVLSSLR